MKDPLTISSEVDNRNSAICRFTVNQTLHIGALMTEIKPVEQRDFTLRQGVEAIPRKEITEILRLLTRQE